VIGYSTDKANKNLNSLYFSNQLKNDQFSTKFISKETIVIQFFPGVLIGRIDVANKVAKTNLAQVFIPKPNSNNDYYSKSLDDYLNDVFLSDGYLLDDNGQQKRVEVGDLNKVIITKKIDNNEIIIDLPDQVEKKLLEYLILDVSHKGIEYQGFDCYAFVSYVYNIEYNTINPGFNFSLFPPQIGDVVVLCTSEFLPNDIRHWAIFLGDDIYLSKFGKSGYGAKAPIAIMDLFGMCYLYEANKVFVAKPEKKARKWRGFSYKVNN
jgi:hypothetical protein